MGGRILNFLHARPHCDNNNNNNNNNNSLRGLEVSTFPDKYDSASVSASQDHTHHQRQQHNQHYSAMTLGLDWVRRRRAMSVSSLIAIALVFKLGEAFAFRPPLQSAARHSIGGRRSGSAVFVSGPAGSPAILDDIQEAKDSALRGNVTSASEIVNVLVANRETASYNQYLDSMLGDVPFWTRLPVVAKFSRRARQRRLLDLLEMTTPMVDTDGGSAEEDGESRLKRRRRALFVLLRSISTSSDYEGISKLLSAAKKDAKSNVSQEEMLKRTPDLETPTYEVSSRSKDGLEIRHYQRFSVASVKMGELKSTGSDQESIQKISNPQLAGGTRLEVLVRPETFLSPLLAFMNRQRLRFIR